MEKKRTSKDGRIRKTENNEFFYEREQWENYIKGKKGNGKQLTSQVKEEK